MTVYVELESTSSWLSCRLFYLFLRFLELIVFSSLDFFWSKIIWVLFNGFISFPEFVFFTLLSDLSRERGISKSLNLMIKVPELSSIDPFLVIKGQLDLNRMMPDRINLLCWDFSSIEEPSQRWNYALQTLKLPVP